MNGIIPLWKQAGMTSHDCVFKVRKILKTKKVGHGGTLDPDVAGVLPIGVGKATKLLDYLHDYPKIYYGTVKLGFSTTTEDASGEIIKQVENDKLDSITTKQIDEAMSSFCGEIIQTPPMYSAVKVNGKRLYEYAREGISVERPSRTAIIYKLKRMTEPKRVKDGLEWSFQVECSKGTYIRTLAVDIGEKLGVPSHMSHLIRLSSGGFVMKEAITLEQLQQAEESATLSSCVAPIEKLTDNFVVHNLTSEEYARVRNGQFLELPYQDNLLALYYQKKCVALYKKKDNVFKPEKMLRLDLA